jgi:hypothetical protein
LTNPSITATQQLIVALSENKSIETLSNCLPKQLTYVDTTQYTGSKYQLEVFKAWLLQHGILLTNVESKADTIVEIFVSVDSFNAKNMIVGIPAIKLTMLASTPQIAFYSKSTEIAINQFNFIAYDAHTGNVVSVVHSKYGVQEYSIITYAFLGEIEKPKLAKSDIVK